MIVISGALVLVALVLLIFGLFVPSLGLVYASIAASLAAFVFLVVGILQRRGDTVPVPAAAGAGDDAGFPSTADEIAAAIRTPETRPVSAQELAAARGAASGEVLVVAGRPRYHVAGCRYLAGRVPDSVDVAQARADGFTPCGVCKPDDALAAAAPAEEAAPEAVEEASVAIVEDAPAKKAPSKAATKVATKVAAKAAPVKAAPKAPAKATATATKAATKTAAKPAAKAAEKATATKAAPKGGVVIIPNRDKFHTPDCRFVKSAAGAETISKATAKSRGYVACGVCNP